MVFESRGKVYLAAAASLMLAASALAGCTEGGVFNPNDSMRRPTTDEEFVWVEEHVATILFVMDSVPGSCGLHESFIQGVPAFFQGLGLTSADVELRFNIAVVGTGSDGAAGYLSSWPAGALGACSVPNAECDELPQPLSSVITETSVAPHRTLACLAEVGDADGGADPYAVAAAALAPERLVESGLVLEESLLAVVIVSDDDLVGCDDPDGFQCHVGTAGTTGAYALQSRLESLTMVSDVYVARISPSDMSSGGSDGSSIDPIGGGTSPVCSLPGIGDGPECEGLGSDLFNVGKIIASAVVPQCLDVAPCPGVGTEDVEVSVEGPDAMLMPFQDFVLVPDPYCPGGYRIDFAEDPFPGELVTVEYPTGTAATCGF